LYSTSYKVCMEAMITIKMNQQSQLNGGSSKKCNRESRQQHGRPQDRRKTGQGEKGSRDAENKWSSNSPSGSHGVPLKTTRYVVRKTAPSAGRSTGPPTLPPTPSSRPSGKRNARSPSMTRSSPGSSTGVRIFG